MTDTTAAAKARQLTSEMTSQIKGTIFWPITKAVRDSISDLATENEDLRRERDNAIEMQRLTREWREASEQRVKALDAALGEICRDSNPDWTERRKDPNAALDDIHKIAVDAYYSESAAFQSDPEQQRAALTKQVDEPANEGLRKQLAEARGALEGILHCTPHIVDEFGYGSAAHKIVYDCGDPFEIARDALDRTVSKTEIVDLTAEQGEE